MSKIVNGFCHAALVIGLSLIMTSCKTDEQTDETFLDVSSCSTGGLNTNGSAAQFENNAFNTQLELLDQFSQPADVFNQNEALQLKLILQNTSSKKQLICFNDGQQYDFIFLTDDEGQTIKWIWSSQQAFTQAITGTALAPGESISWTETLSIDTQIEVGNYKVQAIIELPDVLISDVNAASQFRSAFVVLSVQ